MSDIQDLAARMRRHHIYQPQRVLDDAWIVVRVDGRGFSKFTEAHFDKPFDESFAALMREAATTLVDDLQGLMAYVQSDEISLVLPPSWSLFDRRVEKIASLAASITTASFTLGCGKPAPFDGRLWVGPTLEHVVDYMAWRQADATRCALSTACYWMLRNDGLSARQAHASIHEASVSDKNELMFSRGVNFQDFPVWARRGSVVAWHTYEKEGFNPKTQEAVTVTRRRLQDDPEIPMRGAWRDYIRAHLRSWNGS